ncbi:MAG: calcium-binding protein [Chroococcales cyanobacterium]
MPELTVGLDIQVNTTVEGDQVNPSIHSNGQGTTLVVWESLGNPRGIYAQQYDKEGHPVGDELEVATGNNLQNPIVAIALDGSFVIAWEEAGSDNGIVLQRYDSGRNPVGEAVATSLTHTGNQGSLALDGQGNILLVGAEGNGANAGIFAQRYNTQNQLTQDFKVSNGGINAANPTLAMAANGNYVIAWQQITPGNQGGPARNIVARRFNATGPLDLPAFQVNTTSLANQQNPVVAIAPNGSTFSISWESGGGNAFGGLYAQRYEFNSGEAIGDEIQLDDGINVATKAVAIGADGTLAIAYSETSDIFLKRYDRAGHLLNPEETAPINAYTQGNQSSPAIIPNNQGNFIIVWQSPDQDGSGYGIYARGLSAGVSDEEEDDPDDPDNNDDDPDNPDNDDDVISDLPELMITPTEETLEVEEGSSRELYSVVLSRQPTSEVTIAFDFKTGEGIEPLSPVIFTEDNWDIPQAVTVTAIADDIAQGDRPLEIHHQATSSDPDYDGRELGSVLATLIDVPPTDLPPAVTPGQVVLIEPIGSTEVLQGFRADSYKIALTQQPKDTVTITVELPESLLTMTPGFPQGDSTTEETVSFTISFTPENWNISQTIMVNPLDVPHIPSRGFQYDTSSLGINYAIRSEDPAYNNLEISPLSLTFHNTNNRGMEKTLNDASVMGLSNFDDRIMGSTGNDIIYGREGNDIIYGVAGDNIIYGQEGNNGIEGGSGNDIIYGGPGNDHLYGGAGDDILDGGPGDDRLYGGDGNDVLFGGKGNDRLFGGPGRDTLTGGPGNDSFGIGPGTGGDSPTEADVITDFTKGEDIIEFVGNLSFERLDIYQGSDAYAADTILRDRQTGEYYARLQNVIATNLDPFDFV